jgi:hypothetical protein
MQSLSPSRIMLQSAMASPICFIIFLGGTGRFFGLLRSLSTGVTRRGLDSYFRNERWNSLGRG